MTSNRESVWLSSYLTTQNNHASHFQRAGKMKLNNIHIRMYDTMRVRAFAKAWKVIFSVGF